MHTRFILIEPSHAGNVGAAARAMKVMGFSDLVLVRPRWPNVLKKLETIQRASGALDVLEHARVVDTWEEAVDSIQFLCATAMTPRDFGPPTLFPREAFASEAMQGKSVGLVFGNERFGMKNEDVYRCHMCLQIPSNPQFGSLNLAAALQVLAYDRRLQLGWGTAPAPVPASAPEAQAASADQVQGLLTHLEQALTHIDFLDPTSPKKLIPRLQQLLNRAQVTEDEVHILRGIAKAILKK